MQEDTSGQMTASRMDNASRSLWLLILLPVAIENFNGWEERPGRLKASYAHAHELAICALTAKLS